MTRPPALRIQNFLMKNRKSPNSGLMNICAKYYHIVRNVGGGKHWRIWRIDLQFAKIFPTKVLQIRKFDLT